MNESEIKDYWNRIIEDIKVATELVELNKLTDKQWYLDIEDTLNYYSVLDHTI